MIRDAIARLVQGEDLAADDAYRAVTDIMGGEATPAQIGAFLALLRAKGETPAEISGSARALRDHAVALAVAGDDLVDTCGTGGDGSGSVNVSTGAAIVAAAAGVRVAKHGNRSASSRCGSADVLEALGVALNLSPAAAVACLDQVGLAFLFAPAFHPAMRHAAGPRRELGVRTVFNVIGPLSNPAGARRQVVGVYEAALVPVVATALRDLGTLRAMVVHGSGGLDELSLAGPSLVAEVADGEVRQYQVSPEDCGLGRADVAAVRGGDPATNARLLTEALTGRPGPVRDIVVFNAGAALLVGGRATDLAGGVGLAAAAVDSGAARAKLDDLVAWSREARPA